MSTQLIVVPTPSDIISTLHEDTFIIVYKSICKQLDEATDIWFESKSTENMLQCSKDLVLDNFSLFKRICLNTHVEFINIKCYALDLSELLVLSTRPSEERTLPTEMP